MTVGILPACGEAQILDALRTGNWKHKSRRKLWLELPCIQVHLIISRQREDLDVLEGNQIDACKREDTLLEVAIQEPIALQIIRAKPSYFTGRRKIDNL